MGLRQNRVRDDRLAEEAALLALVRVARPAPEALGELPDEAVGPSGTQGGRAAAGVEPPDGVVGEVPLGPDLLDDRRPGARIDLVAHSSASLAASIRSILPWASSCAR